MDDLLQQLQSYTGSPLQGVRSGLPGIGGFQGNGLLGDQQGGPDMLTGLIDQIRRKAGYRGFDLGQLLQALQAIMIGPGDGGGTGGGGGGGGGGGAGCLHGDTLVRMADGSEKPARDIRVDDLILGLDFQLGDTPQTVTCTNSSRQVCYEMELEGGRKIVGSASHRWFLTGFETGPTLRFEWNGHSVTVQTADTILANLETGGLGEWGCLGEDGESYKILSLTPVGSQVVYWWNCDPNHCYYAGGVLHHNITPETWKGHGWSTAPGGGSLGAGGSGGAA